MKRQSGANANINMLNAKRKVKVTTILFLPMLSAREPPISCNAAMVAKEMEDM